MTSPLSIAVPFPVFQDRDGQPLENGYIWLGVANLNPQTNPVIAYFDEALTIVAPQPLRTLNGYISNAGTPAQVYIDGVNFSILVQDSKGSMVYNFPDGTGIETIINAVDVVYDPAGVNAVPTNVQAKLRETVSVKDFGAVGDGVADDTAAIQAALDNSYDVYFPAGNYIINGTLTIRPYANLQGAGRAGYVTSYTQNLGEGTRLIQTTNAALLYTSTGDIDVDYEGHITISDITLLGGLVTQNEALRGTIGLACYSSQRMICNRVSAFFFSTNGFHFLGALVVTMHDCIADYNQDSGIAMDLGPFGTSGSANSYMSYILGGKCNQNKNYGIKLGTSTTRVSVTNVDIESNGNYFPTGLGIGLAIISGSNTVAIQGGWFEGNKKHIQIGGGDSLVTVPKGTVLQNLELWSVVGAGPKIEILSGINCKIDSCEFFGGGKIVVSQFASAPIITNCYTTDIIIVEDTNGGVVQYDNQPAGSVFSFPVVTGWILTNCTVNVEQIPSPAGLVPVYKVTPIATGNVQIQSNNAPYVFAKNFHTYGWFFKTSSATSSSFWPSIASVNISKVYTSREVNSFTANSEWKWYSLGRCIASSDTGNQAFTFATTATTLDPFFITGFVALPGMVYEPYVQLQTGLPALENAFTPSVYGLSQATTGGTATITDLVNGTVGQRFTLIAEHAITITDGTNIFLAGSANFAMNPTDTLTLIQKADGKWYEISRSDNT